MITLLDIHQLYLNSNIFSFVVLTTELNLLMIFNFEWSLPSSCYYGWHPPFIVCWRQLHSLHCVTVCSLCCTQVFWRPDGWAAGSLFHVEKEATRRILPHWDVTTNWLVCVSTHKQSSSVFVCSCSVEPAEGAVCSHTGQRDSHCGSWATFVHSSVFRCNTMLSLLCFYLHILSLCGHYVGHALPFVNVV